jgi:hypothetical protein
VNCVWNAATLAEQRTLVEDLVDSVCIYPDQITVQVAGAPPLSWSWTRLDWRRVANLMGLDRATFWSDAVSEPRPARFALFLASADRRFGRADA